MASVRDRFKYSGEASGNDPAWRVVIDLGPSRRAGAWIAAVGLLGATATLASDAPIALRVGVVVALAWAAVHAALAHAWRRGRGAVHGFVTTLDGRIEVRRRDGRYVAGRVVPGSFVAPWLVVVRWLPEKAFFSKGIVAFPDSADTESFRRLRILLRWGGSNSEPR